MHKKIVPVLLVLAISTSALAEKCDDLPSCSKIMNKLFGENYVFSQEEAKAFKTIASLPDLSPETGELNFTAALNHAELARAPVGDGKTYRIVRWTTLKEMNIPVIRVAKGEKFPELPNTWDWVELYYELKTPGRGTELEATFRFHMARNERMHPVGDFVIRAAPIPKLKSMFEKLRIAEEAKGGK